MPLPGVMGERSVGKSNITQQPSIPIGEGRVVPTGRVTPRTIEFASKWSLRTASVGRADSSPYSLAAPPGSSFLLCHVLPYDVHVSGLIAHLQIVLTKGWCQAIHRMNPALRAPNDKGPGDRG